MHAQATRHDTACRAVLAGGPAALPIAADGRALRARLSLQRAVLPLDRKAEVRQGARKGKKLGTTAENIDGPPEPTNQHFFSQI